MFYLNLNLKLCNYVNIYAEIFKIYATLDIHIVLLVGTLPLKRYLNALELKLAQLLRGIRPLFFRHNKIYQIIFFL